MTKINCNIPYGYWRSIDNVTKEAAKYTTRKEFCNKNGSAYSSARKNGWLDIVCAHMIKVGNLKRRAIYAYEFSDNHVYVGLTYNTHKRNLQHTQESIKSSVNKHISITGETPIMKVLTDYIDADEASILEGRILDKYLSEGWLILNQSKTGALGRISLKWTNEAIRKEALKYSSRNKFCKNTYRAYFRALKVGILDEVCSHMTPALWDIKTVTEAALKCNNKADFRNNYPGAATYARKANIYKSITQHMDFSFKDSWSEEITERTIKAKTAKKLESIKLPCGISNKFNNKHCKCDECRKEFNRYQKDRRIVKLNKLNQNINNE